MKRKFEERLCTWKNKKRRKPLLVHGARQIGKTTTIRSFGETYFENLIYVNFESDRRLFQDFETDLNPDFLIKRLEIYFGQKINPESTLIFFDEIQVCEQALTSLKYFCEEAPEYYIIGAGSLLGVAINRKQYSFPVGKVEQVQMFPMDLEEFLWAKGEALLAQEIRWCFTERIPMDEVLHQRAMEIYREYLIVGGMPEAVLSYTEEQSFIDAGEIQTNILDAYVADMAKYASGAETTKIMACYDSIPSQLAKDNRKFQYKVVAKGGRASFFGASIDWLLASGIVLKCERVAQGQHPLAIYKNLSAFKLYMSDVGLLSRKAGIHVYDIIGEHDHIFIGALTENYVAGALSQLGYPLYYWASDSKNGGQAEVDFLLEQESQVYPVEVKARENVRSRSLKVFMKRYGSPCGIRISGRNFGYEKDLFSIPLYSVFCL